MPWGVGIATAAGMYMLTNYLIPYPLEDIAPSYANEVMIAGTFCLGYEFYKQVMLEKQSIYNALLNDVDNTTKYKQLAYKTNFPLYTLQSVLAQAILSLNMDNNDNTDVVLQLSNKSRLINSFFKLWFLDDQLDKPQELARVLHDRIKQILPQLESKAQDNPPQDIDCHQAIRNMYSSLNATEHQLNKDITPLPREFEKPSLFTRLSQCWPLSSYHTENNEEDSPALGLQRN